MTKLSSFGLVIFTLAALYVLQHSTPYYSDILSPVAVAGIQGSAVKAERFALGVGNAYRARQLTTPRCFAGAQLFDPGRVAGDRGGRKGRD
jgi:gentisate 1,2-dioxygenase